MTSPSRFQFNDDDARTVRRARPLLISITGGPGSGKTYSALRLGAGAQRVLGGNMRVVDTEHGRALHYQEQFGFRWTELGAPYSPDHYRAAIDFALDKRDSVIVVDSMTHEHTGEGGVLDMAQGYIDRAIQRKNMDPESDAAFAEAQKLKWTSMIDPKRQRLMLNQRIVDAGAEAIFIFCYRAKEKMKPGAGGKPVDMGWQAQTTSDLPYEMTVRFLLEPGSDGRPNLRPDTEFEKLSIKMPQMFRDWFQPGLQLNEDLGEKLARWSREHVGVGSAAAAPGGPDRGAAPPTPASSPRAPAKSQHAREWIAKFVKKGVRESQVLAVLQRGKIEDVTAADERTMAAWLAGLSKGTETLEDLFGQIEDRGDDPLMEG